jgi:hypothetical protein
MAGFFDNSDKAKQIRMIEAFKKKKFIDDEMADFIAKGVFEILGSNFKEAVDKYDINMKDMIRFQLVSEMCRTKREKKGLTFRHIALTLKVPQYKLKYIESSNVKDINVDILEDYIDYLGLRRWFNAWKRHNLDVYKRLSRGKC